MFNAITSPYLVPFDASFKRASFTSEPPSSSLDKKDFKNRLDTLTNELDEQQRVLYANASYSLLLIFQGMDASGKDSTIRAVMSKVDPNGCQVFSFKQPSHKELAHDFLWRTAICLPERGKIGIFNRSYYEEVLTVRVHPEYLHAQNLPNSKDKESFWRHRLESIAAHELHLARNGTVVLKFWLNLSKKEQRKRFLSRIDEPEKNWKFAVSDVRERELWDAYMDAYENALAATSTAWAPWYAVPADDKAYMRMVIADIVVQSIKSLGLTYPRVSKEQQAQLMEMRELLK